MDNGRIWRLVAVRTLDDARDAWRKARASSRADTVRTAYVHAVLAARSLRRTAQFEPREAASILAAADRVDAAAWTLRDQLVEIVERRVSTDGEGR